MDRKWEIGRTTNGNPTPTRWYSLFLHHIIISGGTISKCSNGVRGINSIQDYDNENIGMTDVTSHIQTHILYTHINYSDA